MLTSALAGATSPEVPAATPIHPRVLVIDDDGVILVACRRILESSGYDVDTESDGVRGC
jgi:CheY-like chemotaxis protein